MLPFSSCLIRMRSTPDWGTDGVVSCPVELPEQALRLAPGRRRHLHAPAEGRGPRRAPRSFISKALRPPWHFLKVPVDETYRQSMAATPWSDAPPTMLGRTWRTWRNRVIARTLPTR